MVFWLFFMVLLYLLYGYLSDGFVFLGIRFVWILLYISIFFVRLKLFFFLVVYCIWYVKKCFVWDLRLIFVLESDVIMRICSEDGKVVVCRIFWYFFDCIRIFLYYKCSCKEENWFELLVKLVSYELLLCFFFYVVY